MKGSIILCGVGGMGILKASEIIAEVLLEKGFLVYQSEVHGMAQRGGSVVTHLRYGEDVYAPLLAKGEADFMLAFEQMEALRYLPYLRPQGVILLNSLCLRPPGTNSLQYPHNVPALLTEAGFHVIPVPATEISLRLKDVRLTNVVLLGAFSKIFPISEEEVWERAITRALQGKNLEANLRAFQEGRK